MLVALLVPLLAAASHAQDEPARLRARIVQTVGELDHPSDVAYDPEERRLFVASAAGESRGGALQWHTGRGRVALLELSKAGRARLVDDRLVQGLGGRLSLGVLPVATERYPRGTLCICQGPALPRAAAGAAAEPTAPSLVFADPVTGARLGTLDLGPLSYVARDLGRPVALPVDLAFDQRGDLYLCDASDEHPGVVRIPCESLDDALRGGLTFTPVPDVPSSISIPEDRYLIAIATQGRGPQGGAVHVFSTDLFPLAEAPPALLSGLGELSGVALAPRNRIIAVRRSGDLLSLALRGEVTELLLDPAATLAGPAAVQLVELADGSTLALVPEEAPRERSGGRQLLRLIALPSLP